MPQEPTTLSEDKLRAVRQSLDAASEIDQLANLLNLAGNATRLRLLYLLDSLGEVAVSDLSRMLNVTVSVISQHLAKLKAYGLVAPRRDAQTVYYRLSDHVFNQTLRERFFPATKL